MQEDKKSLTIGSLEAVITDPLFPEIDLRLRAGVHIDIDDIRSYQFLIQTEPYLRVFYQGYACRLVHGQEGYYYLLSEGELLGRRRLSIAEMLTGQILALLRMDPSYLKTSGKIPLEHILSHLEMLLGRQHLAAFLAPRTRGRDAETDNRKIREAVDKAVNGLERLGFLIVNRASSDVFPQKSVMRFATPVRDAGDPVTALRELIRQGEAELMEADDEHEE
ncbi:MAG: chromosome partition protein MukE [Desulfobulbus sp.]|nr:chromosome partition protein MukE [Desulfobulbus sp.]